jgi:hypothetical protein
LIGALHTRRTTPRAFGPVKPAALLRLRANKRISGAADLFRASTELTTTYSPFGADPAFAAYLIGEHAIFAAKDIRRFTTVLIRRLAFAVTTFLILIWVAFTARTVIAFLAVPAAFDATSIHTYLALLRITNWLTSAVFTLLASPTGRNAFSVLAYFAPRIARGHTLLDTNPINTLFS